MKYLLIALLLILPMTALADEVEEVDQIERLADAVERQNELLEEQEIDRYHEKVERKKRERDADFEKSQGEYQESLNRSVFEPNLLKDE